MKGERKEQHKRIDCKKEKVVTAKRKKKIRCVVVSFHEKNRKYTTSIVHMKIYIIIRITVKYTILLYIFINDYANNTMKNN